jgi:hypothetical protein
MRHSQIKTFVSRRSGTSPASRQYQALSRQSPGLSGKPASHRVTGSFPHALAPRAVYARIAATAAAAHLAAPYHCGLTLRKRTRRPDWSRGVIRRCFLNMAGYGFASNSPYGPTMPRAIGRSGSARRGVFQENSSLRREPAVAPGFNLGLGGKYECCGAER